MRTNFGESFNETHGIWWAFIRGNKLIHGLMAGLFGLAFFAVPAMVMGGLLMSNELVTTGLQGIVGNDQPGRDGALMVAVVGTFALITVLAAMSLQIGFLRYTREGRPFRPVINLFTINALKYFGRSLLLIMILFAVSTAVFLGLGVVGISGGFEGAPVLAAVLGFLASLPVVYVSVRLAPWTATFADREGTRLRDGWAATRGAFWYIFLRMLIVPLPVLVLSALAGAITNLVTGMLVGGAILYLLGVLPNVIVPAVVCQTWRSLSDEDGNVRATDAAMETDG